MGELTRAVALLERSRSVDDLARVAGWLEELLRPARREQLRAAFAGWLWTLLRRLAPDAPATPWEPTLEEVRMTLEERVSRWPEPYIRQGIEKGIERGLKQGRAEGVRQGIVEGQRAMLRRQAAARFGEGIAERLSARLRGEEKPERLAEVGEAIVRSETGEDLLRDVGG